MALTTYSELQAEISDFLGRTDQNAKIPTFITLFERAANRRLRVRQMDAFAILTPAGGWADLPDDYLAWKEVTFATGGRYPSLEYVTPTAMNEMYSISQGIPQVFTIYGDQIGLSPIDDSLGVWLDYVQKIPPLTDDDVNWLFNEHPDLYLFGALAEAQGYMVDLEKTAFWKLRRDEIFDEIEKLSNKSRGVGPMRVLGPTP